MACLFRSRRTPVAEDTTPRREPPSYDDVIRAPLGTISFTVNGVARTCDASKATTLLAEYLREAEGLTGTKLSCREGGCGACTVLVDSKPVNSCLRMLGSCDGSKITTIEGLDHPIQEKMIDCDATQCGMCTPGCAMALAAAIDNGDPIEDALDGNLCRCTGFRPILDAGNQCNDIEDLATGKKIKMKTQAQVSQALSVFEDHGTTWYQPRTLEAAVSISADPKIEILGAGTGKGVEKYYDGTAVDRLPFKEIKGVCDISRVPEMLGVSAQRWGAAAPLAEVLKFCEKKSKQQGQVWTSLTAHLRRVAHNQVRSVGTVGGNLGLAKAYPSFASDVGLLLHGLEARASVVDVLYGVTSDIAIADFFTSSLKLLLVSINFPSFPPNVYFFSQKTAQRRQNSHPIINLAAKFVVENSAIQRAVIYFGGVTLGPVRASKTEAALQGTKLGDATALKEALVALTEVVDLVDPSVDRHRYAFRKTLIRRLFYKVMLRLVNKASFLAPELKRAGTEFTRPVSKGTWDIGDASNSDLYPVSAPNMHKLSAAAQTHGSAKYIDDLPRRSGTLFGAFVLATKMGILDAINFPENDDVRYLTGENLKSEGWNNLMASDEKVFLDIGDTVEHVGQRVALVLASTRLRAEKVAREVQISVRRVVTKGIMTIDDAIESKSFFPSQSAGILRVGDADGAMSANGAVVVSGEIDCGHQYHFYMETQTCLAWANDKGGVDLKVSTQAPAIVASTVAKVLNVTTSQVEASMDRAGGGYGGKVSRSCPGACAASCAALLTGSPVAIALSLNDNMAMLGSRRPHKFKFQASVDPETFKITAVKGQSYALQGCASDFGGLTDALDISMNIDGPYKIPNWTLDGYCCKTNTPSNTYCRGPIFLPAHIMIESVIEAAASGLNVDAQKVRDANVYEKNDIALDGTLLDECTLQQCITECKDRVQFDDLQQQVAEFNKSNRYVKRGVAMSPFKYAMSAATGYTATVAVQDDGSVLVRQSGCEIGQGLNIKQAQVAALTLGCDLNLIVVDGVSSHVSTGVTGGSTTSEGNAASVRLACEALKEKLPDLEWTAAVQAARTQGIDLTATARYTGSEKEPGILPGASGQFEQYQCYGASCSLIEYDALSGEPPTILSTSLVTDQGTSMNPNIDAGQVQGAFVMGLGYVTSEEFVWRRDGTLTTNGSWEYKVPCSQDIPVDFNLAFLPNTPNDRGIFSSKAVGEPAILAAASVLAAIRHAVIALRQDETSLLSESSVSLSAPATPAAIAQAADLDWRRFSY